MTCYFLDTAFNPCDYINILAKIIRPGGYWINSGGPLKRSAFLRPPEPSMSLGPSVPPSRPTRLVLFSTPPPPGHHHIPLAPPLFEEFHTDKIRDSI